MSTANNNVTLTDYQGYGSGSYMAYVAPWNKGNMVQGTDYTESIQISSSLFPNSVIITSDWGNNKSSSVFGYNLIAYGDYAGTREQTPIASTEIKNIAALSETHSFTISGTTSGFDVIDDMFLTSGAGSITTHLDEIEVSLHTPAYAAAYVQSLKQIGTYMGSGIVWTVAESSGARPDILFMPSNQADVLSATIDLKGMFDFLVANHILTGNEYFNGMAIGSETQFGDGTTTIGNFSVNYNPGSPSTTSSGTSPSGSAKPLSESLLNDTGLSATDRVTSDPTLTGTSAANTVVTLTEGSVTLGTVTSDANGNWTFKPTGLADGTHTISASAAGSTTSLSFRLDTKPDYSGMMLAHDTGASNKDNITSDPTLNGWTAANAVVTLTEGNQTLGTVIANANGTWTFKPTGLSDGYQTIVATEQDQAGNVATTSISLTLETKAPVLTGGLLHDTGISATDHNTNDPTLTGHADANAVITFMEGTRTLGSTIADATGAWTFDPTGLADGYQAIVGSETNAAGLTTQTNLGFYLDTKPAAISESLKNPGAVNKSTGSTSDPTIGGWTTDNAQVTISEDGKVVGSTMAAANGAWSFTPGNVTAGSHTFVASMSDTAGNIASASLTFGYSPARVAAH